MSNAGSSLTNNVKAISANPKKNNGATIMFGGNPAAGTPSVAYQPANNTPTLFGLSRIIGNVIPGPETSATIANGTQTKGTWKPVAAGTFAFRQVAGSYVMMRVASTLGGVANAVLQSGAAEFIRRRIHQVNNMRISYLYSWAWTADHEGGLTYSKIYLNANMVSGTIGTPNAYGSDKEANVSYAVPGTLVQMQTGKIPTQLNYSARTD